MEWDLRESLRASVFQYLRFCKSRLLFCFLSFQVFVHNCNRIRRIGPTVEHVRDGAADVQVRAEVDEGEEQDLFRGSSNIKGREFLVLRLIRRTGGKMVENEM